MTVDAIDDMRTHGFRQAWRRSMVWTLCGMILAACPDPSPPNADAATLHSETSTRVSELLYAAMFEPERVDTLITANRAYYQGENVLGCLHHILEQEDDRVEGALEDARDRAAIDNALGSYGSESGSVDGVSLGFSLLQSIDGVPWSETDAGKSQAALAELEMLVESLPPTATAELRANLALYDQAMAELQQTLDSERRANGGWFIMCP